MKRVFNHRSNTAPMIISAMAALVLVVLGATSTVAQNQSGNYYANISAAVGLVPGKTVRISLVTPGASGPLADGGGPRVRVFDGNGGLLLEKETAIVSRGGFSYVDIGRGEIALPGEARSGRLQVRIEIDYIVRGSNGDSAALPATMELLADETGEPLMIGMLLPAIQKVR